ncbi:hypothetical protein [Dongia sedimenti]|uniref:DUF922 domain-containing protein n=1 Tax=Dongia sedimenti TaxID=3064282 RepID=A0ABU0YMB4_9PROT|nr:hypothetical protein [Rhodospirillaceae bacterium R-7]
MRHAVPLAFVLLLAVAAPAAACTAEEDPAVTVAVREAPLRIDRSLSRSALAARVGGVGPNWSAFGLTEASHETEINYGFVIVQTGKQYCATLSKVAVEITLGLVVHYASELRRGTCANQEIEEHEQQHVDLERKMLPLVKARVEAAVAGLARKGMVGKAVDASTEALEARMSDTIQRVLNAFADEKNRQHDVFDTREAYVKLSLRCGRDEIRALLGG